MTRARPTILLRALLALLMLGLAALNPAPATSQATSQATSEATSSAISIAGNNIRAQLVADGPPVPGETWMVALRFSPRSPEWHGYWSNPGDAGMGMTLRWQLPLGWSAGEPLYPVPQQLVIAGLMNHVFEGEYAVLVPITVPANAVIPRAMGIAVLADYLACTDRICVPERARLTLAPAAAVWDERFTRWRAALAPPLDLPARFEMTGRALRLAIPLPSTMALGDPHVFVENRELVAYAAPQRFARSGDILVAEIPLAEGAAAPTAIAGILAIGGGNGLRFEGSPGAVATNGEPIAAASAAPLPSLWLALAAALLGGLILNVMPCVFPILSLKALALAKAGGEARQARRDALGYTGGVIAACLALGAIMLALRAAGEQVGWAFQLQEPGVVAALLVLAVAITANFLGLFALPGLALAGRGGGTGSFATGLLAAFVATPCTGPFMAAALGAALLLPAPQALVLFAALGLGLALPFLLLGFVPRLRAMLPRPGAWMATFQRWMALPMGLTALALAWLTWRLGGPGFALAALALAGIVTALLAVVWRARSLTGRPRGAAMITLVAITVALIVALPHLRSDGSAQAEAGILDASPFSEAALAKARAAGKPVFVYFTADWCLSCKVNESAAIERESTRAAFERAGVVVLRGDWTRRDEAITRFLTAQGAAGVPLYLWYPARSSQGPGMPRQLPQVLTPGLLERLARGMPG